MKGTLTREEREVVLNLCDSDPEWSVFTDSQRLTRRLKRLAAAWGIEPQKLGEGWEFTLPLRAISFRSPKKPPTERQREAGRRLGAKSRRDGAAVSLRQEVQGG